MILHLFQIITFLISYRLIMDSTSTHLSFNFFLPVSNILVKDEWLLKRLSGSFVVPSITSTLGFRHIDLTVELDIPTTSQKRTVTSFN